MSADARAAYKQSAVLVIVVFAWLGTLAWLVPLSVSLLATAVSAAFLLARRRGTSEG